jgi:hypothetical protein
MKQFFFGLLACLAVALPAQGADLSAQDGLGPDKSVAPPANSSLCLDSMEMEPWTDDLLPMPVSLDGGCSVPETPLAT